LNWLAILVAAISTMVVGFLWYSPLLFAKAWMREMGYESERQSSDGGNEKKRRPGLWRLLCCQLGFHFHVGLDPHGLRAEDLHFGLMAAFHVWLGFVATVQFTGALFASRA